MTNVELRSVIIGDRIRECLKEENIPQRKMAIDLGMKEATLNRYITGTREIPAVVVGNVAEYLGVSADYLLRGTSPEEGSAEAWRVRAIRSEAALGRIKETLGE